MGNHDIQVFTEVKLHGYHGAVDFTPPLNSAAAKLRTVLIDETAHLYGVWEYRISRREVLKNALKYVMIAGVSLVTIVVTSFIMIACIGGIIALFTAIIPYIACG